VITIFYDLETSDSIPLGQILNYCFIAVDKNFSPIATLSNNVKISRLQLPVPGAILTNRIDVIEHQEESTLNEREAMLEIRDFIGSVILKAGGRICFAGFNSAKFDLPYLRTSFIRNGINPYFGGKLCYKDLFFAAKKLSVSKKDFPRSPYLATGEKSSRLSLKLETLCRELGLLKGVQTHQSEDDVLLTIELAKTFKNDFGLDLTQFEAYEAGKFHQFARQGHGIASLEPNYDLSIPEISITNVMTLLDADHRYALWIDLARYKEGAGRDSIRWLNQGNSYFFSGGEMKSHENLELAPKALAELQSINLKNFFSRSTCDVEQDIYRLDFDAIGALESAIWKGDSSAMAKINNEDARIAFIRYKLSNYEWGGAQDDKVKALLKEYALHRYGGAMQVKKILKAETSTSDYHVTFKSMLEDLEARKKEAVDKDKKLLESLKEFYMESDIYLAAGEELLR